VESRLSFFEEELRNQGIQSIAGVDEAGRGPLAGPVVAAACILPYDVSFGVDDSKKLSAQTRDRLFVLLTEHPQVIWAASTVAAEQIDQINILQATLLAMKEAILALSLVPEFILVDGLQTPDVPIPRRAIVQGDARSASIAAASIIAKVTRDRMMKQFHAIWPQYRFDENQGYGTKAHLDALQKHGPCPIHRKTYQPVISMLPFPPFGL
jgi:ribonuclease HII